LEPRLIQREFLGALPAELHLQRRALRFQAEPPLAREEVTAASGIENPAGLERTFRSAHPSHSSLAAQNGVYAGAPAEGNAQLLHSLLKERVQCAPIDLVAAPRPIRIRPILLQLRRAVPLNAYSSVA
jgi:hypothetical protein